MSATQPRKRGPVPKLAEPVRYSISMEAADRDLLLELGGAAYIREHLEWVARARAKVRQKHIGATA